MRHYLEYPEHAPLRAEPYRRPQWDHGYVLVFGTEFLTDLRAAGPDVTVWTWNLVTGRAARFEEARSLFDFPELGLVTLGRCLYTPRYTGAPVVGPGYLVERVVPAGLDGPILYSQVHDADTLTLALESTRPGHVD